MSRTIATSQSREPPSAHAVPDRPPPTSGDPSRISADGVTSPSPRLGFATAGRDTLGSALAGEGPSCSVGERRWNDRESRPAGALRPDHQAGQPTGALGRDRGRATTKGFSGNRERVLLETHRSDPDPEQLWSRSSCHRPPRGWPVITEER